MRHRVYGKHLGRNEGQRQALFKTLVQSLFLHGTIQTSETKAKAIKGLVDEIITSAKGKNTPRKLRSYIVDKDLQDRLVKEVLPKLGNRTSGYTKVVRIGPRQGDQTNIVKMSLIGAEQLKPLKKELKQLEEKKVEVKPAEKKAAPAKKAVKKVKASSRKKI
ncbi:50S ribosomal protein L17 [Candidatus Daviesbacteria bacterium]|nr:50S ribosomal protein L17 [Candidatus Daviesbacteria bacterium]